MITQKEIKEFFQYKNNNLYWKKINNHATNIKIGDLSGHIDTNGYRIIGVNNKYYKAHQLIFLYHYGYIPDEIDHIDNNRLNNNINNLRPLTHQQNSMNSTKNKAYKHKPTSSIYKGVSWHKQIEKWISRIRINGKNKSLGVFNSEINAALAYNRAAIKYYGEYANLNVIKGYKYNYKTDKDELIGMINNLLNNMKLEFEEGNISLSIIESLEEIREISKNMD